MAMTMNGEYELPVPPQTVWEKLNDAATLKACIQGCEQLDKTSDTEFQAVATVKIGPVKAKFKGKVALSDLDPPNGYKISGQGDGGQAHAKERRHSFVVQCRCPDRRQACAAWSAARQWRRQESRRRFFCELCQCREGRIARRCPAASAEYAP